MSRYWMMLALFVAAADAHAADAFDKVHCDADVAKALIGQKIPNGPASELEKRHAALGLKLEGSDMLDDPFNYEAWTICGDTYHVISKKDVVADAVKADHSKATPAFLGACDKDGVPMRETTLAILKAQDGAEKLPATAAWTLDEHRGKFVAISADKLMCPRDGIATADGGP